MYYTTLPERSTTAISNDGYEMEARGTEGVPVFSSSALQVHPELAEIRTQLAAGTITSKEIWDALTAAIPNLVSELQQAKAEIRHRRRGP